MTRANPKDKLNAGKLRYGVLHVLFWAAGLSASVQAGGAADTAELAGGAVADYAVPVRPIGVNGQPAWNVAAKQFTYAPTFGFEPVAGAVRYRFEVVGADAGKAERFEALRPTAALTPVWAKVPVGDVTVTVSGLTADGKAVGAPRTRRFWKMPPFREGAYPKATRGYGETAALIWKYVFDRPYLQYMLEKGEPDPKYPLNSYPAKMLASQIWAMLRYAKLSPQDAPRAMKIAKAAADRLIARAQPPGSPLAFFPPTYDGRGEAGNNYLGEKFKGMHMLHYPSAAGMALLDYAEASGEAACRDFAIKIADTYVRLQGEDGTWWLKMDERDGKPVCKNRLVPIRVLEFLERVAKRTGDKKYAAAAERAFGFIEKGPLTDWNWEGQFEDIYPAPLYANLTKHGACDVAIYLLKRFPGDTRRLAQARELLRWSEDQFVVWDGRYFANNGKWTTPVALEQYHCYAPIDESAAKMIMTYLALYRAERNPRDLAKARALGDAFTRVTLDDGRLRTYWNTDSRTNEHEDWVNGQVVSALALEDLASFGESSAIIRVR